jgi:hypothetical protein
MFSIVKIYISGKKILHDGQEKSSPSYATRGQ